MSERALVIRMMRPGGTVVVKTLGGPGKVPQGMVDSVTARFLAYPVYLTQVNSFKLVSSMIILIDDDNQFGKLSLFERLDYFQVGLLVLILFWRRPRLHNYVLLIKAAIKAEVPQWEILSTLGTFFTTMSANKSGDDVAKRVAAFFKINPVSR